VCSVNKCEGVVTVQYGKKKVRVGPNNSVCTIYEKRIFFSFHDKKKKF
jgi:hypothetical protein